MVTPELKQSLKDALDQIRIAEDEMNRPEEDMVILSACMGARKAISGLMSSYLTSIRNNDIGDKNLNDLLSLCKKSDPSFNSIELTGVVCSHMNTHECDGMYCLGEDRVSDCIKIANSLKAIVFDKLSLTERELR
jgi:hypothetical protein